MQLNDGTPQFRYQIASKLNVSVKKLNRMLHAWNMQLDSGLIMPYDIIEIERRLVEKNKGKNFPFDSGDHPNPPNQE